MGFSFTLSFLFFLFALNYSGADESNNWFRSFDVLYVTEIYLGCARVFEVINELVTITKSLKMPKGSLFGFGLFCLEIK